MTSSKLPGRRRGREAQVTAGRERELPDRTEMNLRSRRSQPFLNETG